MVDLLYPDTSLVAKVEAARGPSLLSVPSAAPSTKMSPVQLLEALDTHESTFTPYRTLSS